MGNYNQSIVKQQSKNTESQQQDDLQEQIMHIHQKLGLQYVDIFEQARLNLLKKGYIIKDYISKGGQAQVFKGYSDTHKRECAIRLSTNTAEGYQSLLKEFETIKHIKLPLNIIELLAVEYLEDIQICAHILELCQFSLEDEMNALKKNNTWYDKEQQYFIIFSLCDALIEIQSYEILHFDIQPSNILKTLKGEYVLSDFGMSKRIPKNEHQVNKTYGFNFKYISPEQFQNLMEQGKKNINLTPLSYSSDLYSMSLVFLSILGFNVDFFFNSLVREQQFKEIALEENQKRIFESFRKSLLVKDPSSRIEALRLQQFLLSALGIKNKKFLLEYQNKIEKILDQNKYDNSKNLRFSSLLYPEYSYTHLMISKKLKCKIKESKSLYFFGTSFLSLGNIDKAHEYYEKSLEMRKSLYKGNHPDIATSLNNIGLCYQTLGQSDKALGYYQQSLEMTQSLYQKYHPEISRCLNNLGGCYKILGKADKAFELFQQSLEITQYLYEGNHPSIAKSLNNLGGYYQTLGKADKAQEYYELSLEMRKSHYKGDHPDIARSLNDLGNCYKTFGKGNKALEYYQQSLKMTKSIYQGDHAEIVISLNNIAGCYKFLGKSDEALEYYKQSYEMTKYLYKENHPNIATSLNNLGGCYETLGEAGKALGYYKKSLEMKKSLYKGNHHVIATTLQNLQLCYQNLGNGDKALEYYQQYTEMINCLNLVKE